MSSLRRHEGYLLLDNRDSPGVEPGTIPTPRNTTLVGRNRLYETATVTCSHCQQILILNPERTRERGYCKKCDHYICDTCATVMAQTLQCVPFRKILDDAQEAASRLTVSPIIIP